MGRYLLSFGFLLLAVHLAGVETVDIHGAFAGYLAGHRIALLSGGVLAGLGLIGTALFFGMMGLFNLMFSMARLFHELTKALLCGTVLLALLFWFALKVDFLLADAGILLIVLYLWLYGTAFALRVFDFNYPIRDGLVAYTSLPLFCLLLIRISSMIR